MTHSTHETNHDLEMWKCFHAAHDQDFCSLRQQRGFHFLKYLHNLNVIGLWEEAVQPRENPHRHGENMQTPRKIPQLGASGM